MTTLFSNAENFAKAHPIALTFTFGSLTAALLYLYSKSPQKNQLKQKVTQQQYKIRKRSQRNKRTDSQNRDQSEEIQKQLGHLKQTRQKMLKLSKNFNLDYYDQQKFAHILTQDCILNLFDQSIGLVDAQQLNEIYALNRKARRTVFQKILINAQVRQSNRRDSLQSVRSQQRNPYTGQTTLNLNTPRNMQNFSIKQKLQTNRPITYPESLSISQTYYRFICTFQQQLKYLIQKTQKDFVAFLGIDYNLVTQSIDYHTSKEDNQDFRHGVEQWASSFRQTLKNKLFKYNQPINAQLIKQIMVYQIKYLKQKRHKLLQMIRKLGISNEEQVEALPTLLATILQDAVFSKYNVQIEQMAIDLAQLQKNKQLENLIQEFQILTQKIAQEMYQQAKRDEILNQSTEYY